MSVAGGVAVVDLDGGDGEESEEAGTEAESCVVLPDVVADEQGSDEAEGVVDAEVAVGHGVVLVISLRAEMRMMSPRAQNVISARTDMRGGGGL